MSDPIFDLDSREPLFKISDDMAIDSKGNFKMRMDDNMVMDMDTGKMRFTTTWESDGDGGDDDF